MKKPPSRARYALILAPLLLVITWPLVQSSKEPAPAAELLTAPAPDPVAVEEVLPAEEAKVEEQVAIVEEAPPAVEKVASKPSRKIVKEEEQKKIVEVKDVEPAPQAVEPPAEEKKEEEPAKVEVVEDAVKIVEDLPDSPIQIVFKEDLEWLRTAQITLIIDGREVANKAAKDGLETKTGLVLHEGRLHEGKHQVALKIKMIGDSEVFSYLEGYTFTIKHQATFTAVRDRNTRVVISAAEKGGITDQWKDRVALEVQVGEGPSGVRPAERG